MSDHVRQTIADLEKHLAEDEQRVLDRKRLINQLSEMAGLGRRYSDAELQLRSAVSLSIRPDQFYGQPLAKAVKQILEMRKALNQGAATIAEIYAALVSGGYAFDTVNDDYAKRGLRMSLTKNTAQFHKLPNNTFGAKEWYPSIPRASRSTRDSDDAAEAGDTADETEDPK